MLLLLILAISLLSPLPALAAEVLIVQSSRNPAYMEALKGFKAVCASSSHTIVLEDYAETDVVRIAREEQPSIILAVGDPALASVKKVRRVPVIAIMALNLPFGDHVPANLTGVRMTIAPERYMGLFKSLQLGRVGVVFNPKQNGGYIRRARQAAHRVGVELIPREVQKPRQALQQLATLKGNVDSIWLLPDSTTMTKENKDAVLLFAMEEGKPVIAFSDLYLAYGAAASLEADRYAMGKQGGEIANRLLGGAALEEVPIEDPRTVFLKTNTSVLRKLGLAYSVVR